MKAKRETDPKINTDNTAVDLKKESKKQPEIKKISDLHLAKLQDSIKKENQINKSISELFYKKVHIE